MRALATKASVRTHRLIKALLLGLVLLLVPIAVALAAGNIDSIHKWAWGTNVGWINFNPENGGVAVYSDHLEGYAWGENVGWIRLGTCTSGSPCTYANTGAADYGVNNDGAGNLSGYAWSTNAGWINFDPDGDERVTIDPLTGDFNGYAWGENVGWIHFQNADPAYRVNTTWRIPSSNIDPTHKWAWGTNVGWINFDPENGGVTVYTDHLEGYAWGENVGWIRLGTCTSGSPCTYANTGATDYGVNNDGAGNLSGYAWSANAGWINFDPDGDEHVTVDPLTGDFNGYAWGENVGWIHFQNAEPAYRVNTTWRSSAPIADAGADQSVDTNTTVTLDGRDSYDIGGDGPLTYLWAQTGGPEVTFTQNVSVTSFTAPSDPAVLTFSLIVTDSLGLPDLTPDMVVITVNNQPPVANAGTDQSVKTSSLVTLDGSASTDPDDDDPLAYLWAQTGGLSVTLSSQTDVTTTFVAPGDTTVLTLTLVVTDGLELASAPAEVVIVVDRHYVYLPLISRQ